VTGAVAHVEQLPGIYSIELVDEEIVVMYDSSATSPEIIANTFNLQGFPVEISGR
jgi:hypothetical protein